MPLTVRVPTAALACLFIAGCAAQPNIKRDPRDPWERMNRATYGFNDKLDRAIVKPVASGYRKVTPRLVQTGIRNFFDNVEYPTVIVNDLLQAQFKPFLNDTGRLLLNTTLGLGGLFDPATRAGLDKNERDFGQTFGKWGIKSGPYLVIPFLGPADVRDGIGLIPAVYTNGLYALYNDRQYWAYYSLYVLDKVDLRARYLDASKVLESSYDPYAFLRNAYLQRRDFLVNGGQSSEEEEREKKLLEESGDDSEQQSPQQPKTEPAEPPPP